MSTLVGGEKVVKTPQKKLHRKARAAAAAAAKSPPSGSPPVPKPTPSKLPEAPATQKPRAVVIVDGELSTDNPHYNYDAQENDWNDSTVNERRIRGRQRQIDIGYNTTGYQRYIKHIPKEQRTRWDPATPDVTQKCSKRGWEGKCHEWRRMLHCYDPAPPVPPGWEASRQLVELDTRENAISFSNKLVPISEMANHKFDAHLRVVVARISDYQYSRTNKDDGKSVVEHFTVTFADHSGFLNCLVLNNRSRALFMQMKVGRVYVVHHPILLDTQASIRWVVIGPRTTLDEVIFCAEDITLREISLFVDIQ